MDAVENVSKRLVQTRQPGLRADAALIGALASFLDSKLAG